MQKISTMRTSRKNIFQGQLAVGLDLGDRSSAYCVLNEPGEIVWEHKLATTPEAMKQVFGSMPRCRIAMETGLEGVVSHRFLTTSFIRGLILLLLTVGSNSKTVQISPSSAGYRRAGRGTNLRFQGFSVTDATLPLHI